MTTQRRYIAIRPQFVGYQLEAGKVVTLPMRVQVRPGEFEESPGDDLHFHPDDWFLADKQTGKDKNGRYEGTAFKLAKDGKTPIERGRVEWFEAGKCMVLRDVEKLPQPDESKGKALQKA